MRDIYGTAKKAQMAPVRGRVKAMMAQPRAVAQARKTARQTTGFQEGGKVSTPMTHDSDFTRWFESQYGGTEKGKPHSTLEGRSAAGRRYMRRAEKYWTNRREEEKKRKDDPHHPKDKRRAGPRAPARPRPKAGPPAGRPKSPGEIPKKEKPGMNVKKGGVMNYKKGGATPEARAKGSAKSREHRARIRRLAERVRDKDRPSQRDIKRAGQLFKVIDWADHADDKKVLLKKKGGVMKKKPGWHKGVDLRRIKLQSPKGKPRSTVEGRTADWVRSRDKLYKEATKKKKGGKVDKKWIQKAVNPKHKGYCTPMTKKTCTPARKRLAKLFKSKARKGWANGGTVVMPTVGNDVRTRAYKHGALIHPRPRPTTMAHGRARGVGIAKRGW